MRDRIDSRLKAIGKWVAQRPVPVAVSALIAAGGLATAFLNTSPADYVYTGCGTGYAWNGSGYTETAGYGTCSSGGGGGGGGVTTTAAPTTTSSTSSTSTSSTSSTSTSSTSSTSTTAPTSSTTAPGSTTTGPTSSTTVPGAPPTIPGLPPAPPISNSQGGSYIPINQGTLTALTSIIGATPPQPIAAGVESPGGGVFVVDSSGNVFTGNGANYLGGISQLNPNMPPGGNNTVHLVAPIINMILFQGNLNTSERAHSSAAVGGYYLVASDGGVFAFGSAPFYGSIGGHVLNKPVVGMAMAPGNAGYWEVASDGGVFTFGNIGFYGSLGNIKLDMPITGMAAAPDGKGYWLVAADGGVFTFGAEGFYGSEGGQGLSGFTSIVPTSTGHGYWLTNSSGQSYPFGDA